jgi:hypothetical protein
VKYEGIFNHSNVKKYPVNLSSPNIAVGDSGSLKLNLPGNWNDYDAIYLTATDPFGRLINRWSWTIIQPEDLKNRIVNISTQEVKGFDDGTSVSLISGKTEAKFSKKTGLLTEVKVNDQLIPFGNGPVFVGDTLAFKEISLKKADKNWVVEVTYDKSPECFARWTMLPGGWLELEYQLHPVGKADFAGITFDYPEKSVEGATLIANGPYHVWKNRLKGNEFGLFEKKYNNTITGYTWDYPEFKGYYSNFYAVRIQTKELPFTIVSATEDLFLHLFTPQASKFARGGVVPPFPSGNISILNGISAIGTKFTKAEAEGPQSQRNDYQKEAKPLSGKLYFRFGE